MRLILGTGHPRLPLPRRRLPRPGDGVRADNVEVWLGRPGDDEAVEDLEDLVVHARAQVAHHLLDLLVRSRAPRGLLVRLVVRVRARVPVETAADGVVTESEIVLVLRRRVRTQPVVPGLLLHIVDG